LEYFTPIFADSSSSTTFGVIGAVMAFLSLMVAITTFIVAQRVKKDAEHKKTEQENVVLKLTTQVKDLIDEKLVGINEGFKECDRRLDTLEKEILTYGQTSKDYTNTNDLRSVKYQVDTNISEVKADIRSFKEKCSTRHEKLTSLGSISDLKKQIESFSARLDKIQDFHQAISEKYVQLGNYRQEMKMFSSTINELRQDMRVMMEMLDKLR
jgi:DNA repair ATPase RecN